MTHKRFYIFLLFFCGIFCFSFLHAKEHKSANVAHDCITVKTCNSHKHPAGNSPFIRFHHGIEESGVSVSLQNEMITLLKPDNTTHEKFAGIVEYLSGTFYLVPVTEAFLYCRPLRSPPVFC